jgi:hypothetical protein
VAVKSGKGGYSGVANVIVLLVGAKQISKRVNRGLKRTEEK